MKELFQKLLEADILTDDVKEELEQAFETRLAEAVEAAKAEAKEQIQVELTEQWVNERDSLIEAIDTQVGDFLTDEMEELKGDISRFRDLEAEYAEKLVESRADMANQLKSDLAELVEQVDSFLEIRLHKELTELKEDIDRVKELEFGRHIFESFIAEYREKFVDEEGVEKELHETVQRADHAEAKVARLEKQISEAARNEKLGSLLSNLEGTSREVMETLLDRIPTDSLEEGYEAFLPRVLRESVSAEQTEETTKVEEDKVLAEGVETTIEDQEPATVTVTGDGEALTESHADEDVVTISEDVQAQLRNLAGITQ